MEFGLSRISETGLGLESASASRFQRAMRARGAVPLPRTRKQRQDRSTCEQFMTKILRSIGFLAIAFLAITTVMAEAQSPASATIPPEMASQNETVPQSAASNVVTVKQGTEVRLKLGQRLSVKTSTINEPVELVLDEDLKAGDVVVANKGARVIGRVTEGKKDCVNGPCGWRDKRQPGKQLSIRLEY